MDYLKKYDFLKKKASGYHAGRILAQIGFAHKMSVTNGNAYSETLEEVLDGLCDAFQTEGALTQKAAEKAEKQLSVLASNAKEYKIICAGHAHIDMNWMWDFPETVAITVDTIRTVLDLMDEYPKFTFSQSQASIYRIIEEHEPEMLDEIRKRIAEGRWEVTASTWVEADKNMGSGESQARHLLYTKRYIEKLLHLSPDKLDIDYEPDTFGHSAMVPEILAKGGVRYYYHCRGYEGHFIYRWKAPSGRSVLVYREPVWYNEFIENDMALFIPEFCKDNGIKTVLKVYGVGDHGGGPTRMDIERILDMMDWPVFPRIDFGTYGEFFRAIEEEKTEIPVVEGELNAVFTGCYTSQSRIKKANKTAEIKLVESEVISSMAAVSGSYVRNQHKYFKAWERVLFNQFHDILPGSGIIDTREFALGNFQKSLAESNSLAKRAIRDLVQRIDTSWIEKTEIDEIGSKSEGAGVGFALNSFRLPATERGKGLERVLHLFNPTQFLRKGVVEATVWDWKGDFSRISVRDRCGNSSKVQVLDKEPQNYWAHEYVRILFEAEVPAFGYSTYYITEETMDDICVSFPDWPRLEEQQGYVLENELVRAELNPISLALSSFTDRETGAELINEKAGGARFNLVHEDTTKGMSSWVIGRYKKVLSLGEGFVIKDSFIEKGALRQWIRYTGSFSESELSVIVSLDKGSKALKYEVECNWNEKAVHKVTVPQLNFTIPSYQEFENYNYDIPFGFIERAKCDMDMPALSFAASSLNKDGLMLISADRYGFRCSGDSMTLTLLRGSTNPDPHPEHGITKMKFAVVSVCGEDELRVFHEKNKYMHEIAVIPGKVRKGILEPNNSFLEIIEGQVLVTAVKMAEDNYKKLVIRLFEPTGEKQKVSLRLGVNPVGAYLTDINEDKKVQDLLVENNIIKFETGKNSIETLVVTMPD